MCGWTEDLDNSVSGVVTPSHTGMTKQVAFLRAINVAGHAKVKKDDLKRAFTTAGCRDVQTYIQSGNVIYGASAGEQAGLTRKIQAKLNPLVGGEAIVIFRTLRHLERLVKANPFAAIDAGSAVKLYVALLAGRPGRWPALPLEEPKEALRAFSRKKNDVFIVSGRKQNGFYGFPNNFIEKELGVRATSRNWNTVTRIVEKFC